MAENHEGDSRWMSGFVTGFVLGVLVCLGVGGSLYVVQGRRAEVLAREMQMMAEQARAEAEQARRAAEAALRAERDARMQAEKGKKE